MTDNRRWSSAAIAVAFALTGLLSVESPAQAAVALAGTTTVTAAGSSSVLVEVPRDVPFSLTPEAGPGLLSVHGNGRAIAATLQPLASREISEATAVAVFNGCATPGCAPAPGQSVWLYTREPTGTRTGPDGRKILASGTYRLTVLTDGAPAEVRIRLDGVDGSATATTSDPVESGFAAAREAVAVPAAPVVWSGSADLNLASENTLVLAYLQQDSPTGTIAGLAGACHFTGSTRPLLGVPAPGCPFQPNGGDGEARVGSVGTEVLTLGSASRARFATSLAPTTGVQQAGLWSTRVGVTTTPLAYFAWLRLS